MERIKIEIKTDNQWYPRFEYFYTWSDATKFMREMAEEIQWWPFSCNNKQIPEDIYREFRDYIPIQNYVMYNPNISKDFMRQMDDNFDWYHWPIYNHKIEEKYLHEFMNRWEWRNIAMYFHLPLNFIKRYKEEVNKVFYLMLEFNKYYSPDEQYEIQMALK